MALLKFLLYDLDENAFEINNVISYELSRNIDAACDGLRLSFTADFSLDEINRVEIYNGDEKIFNGCCDTQRDSVSSQGYDCFIYARSSACILVDNEAKPFTYNCPSAKTLYIENAEEHGFIYSLPEIYCNSGYQVNKGMSCFSAINSFVYGITGKNMLINVNNEIVLPDSNSSVSPDDYHIISEKRIINRGSVISSVDYRAYNENDYSHHIKSRFFESKKINRTIKRNLLSLPEWQRDCTLMNTLRSAASSYNTIELVIDGCADLPLYADAEYKSSRLGNVENYCISSVCIIGDKNGERTRLTLSKSIDLKEITYVAK